MLAPGRVRGVRQQAEGVPGSVAAAGGRKAKELQEGGEGRGVGVGSCWRCAAGEKIWLGSPREDSREIHSAVTA